MPQRPNWVNERFGNNTPKWVDSRWGNGTTTTKTGTKPSTKFSK